MSLSTNQVLQLIKKYSRVSNHNDHDLLENIGTKSHEDLETKVTTVPYTSTILEISCNNDAMFILDIEDDTVINFVDIPSLPFIHTILLEIKSSNNNQYNIILDALDKEWFNNDKLQIVEANKRYLLSILVVGNSHKFINYLEFDNGITNDDLVPLELSQPIIIDGKPLKEYIDDKQLIQISRIAVTDIVLTEDDIFKTIFVVSTANITVTIPVGLFKTGQWCNIYLIDNGTVTLLREDNVFQTIYGYSNTTIVNSLLHLQAVDVTETYEDFYCQRIIGNAPEQEWEVVASYVVPVGGTRAIVFEANNDGTPFRHENIQIFISWQSAFAPNGSVIRFRPNNIISNEFRYGNNLNDNFPMLATSDAGGGNLRLNVYGVNNTIYFEAVGTRNTTGTTWASHTASWYGFINFGVTSVPITRVSIFVDQIGDAIPEGTQILIKKLK